MPAIERITVKASLYIPDAVWNAAVEVAPISAVNMDGSINKSVLVALGLQALVASDGNPPKLPQLRALLRIELMKDAPSTGRVAELERQIRARKADRPGK